MKFKKKWYHYIMDFLSLAVIGVMFVYLAVEFKELPNNIPMKFDKDGIITSLGPKQTLWIIPSIMLAVFVAVSLLTSTPGSFKFPVKLNKYNYLTMYSLFSLMFETIELICMIVVCFVLHFSIVCVPIPNELMLILVGLVIITAVLFIILMKVCNKKINKKYQIINEKKEVRKMRGLKNVKVYVEGQGVIETSIGFENGRIAAIGSDLELEELVKLPADAVVVPGFIDQHIHGAAKSDAMDGSVEDIANIANAIAKEGTTAFLATTMTQSPENICKALNSIKEYMDTKSEIGAQVLGVHLEGPYISKDFIGAQPLEYVAVPSVESFKQYQEASGDTIKIVSLAPEVEGSTELIDYLVANNIVASCGHTSAKYDDIEKAVAHGASNVTHTYNAQRPIHHREIGTVGSALMFDELHCELICDTIHVSVPAIKLVLKNKPLDKVTLITDSMRAKHVSDGNYDLGGQLVIVKNGEARLENGTLAGSVLKMSDAVKNVVTKVGIPFTQAIDMATINPARHLGVAEEMGSIALGKKANITVLDNEYNVLLTVREGKVIYQK